MTRKLPWKRKVDDGSAAANPSRATKTASPRPRKSSAGPSSVKKPRSSLGQRQGSTSPPPAPPPETFMISGIENDDKYRMVEDEFVFMAGTFTAHLHAAEYQRLKALAKSQNAEAISNISRPVTSSMTDFVKRRREVLLLGSKQRNGLKRALGGTADEEAIKAKFAGSSLQGLMDSTPQKSAIPLTVVAPTISNTRAAAGYHEQSPRKPSLDRLARPARAMDVDDSDDDDLDAPPRPVKQPHFKDQYALRQQQGRSLSTHTTGPQASLPRPAVAGPPRASTFNGAANGACDGQNNDSDGSDDMDFLRKSRERRAQQRARTN